MECNKDEAVRAKEIAEKKFLDKDIAGARKFALKAQNLYPGLEGISQMLATLDVYIAAENKINGEGNWYGILGASPSTNDGNIRKQFRKLALMFHPDKNKTIGAEGAFKLISEAWSLLSDKSKKLAYDQRNASLFQNGGGNVGPSPPSVQSNFHNFAKSRASQKTSQKKAQKGNANKVDLSSAPASSEKPEKNTFWTGCHRCKMQYEYLRMYMNKNLLCPNCHEAFFAVEIAPPSSKSSKMASESNYSQQQHTNFQWVPFSRSSDAASSVQAASMVQQAYEKVKRERQKAQAAKKREEALRKKQHGSKRARHVSPPGNSDYLKKRRGLEDCGTRSDINTQINTGNRVGHSVSLSGLKVGKAGQVNACNTSGYKISNDIAPLNMKKVLMDKAREDIHMRLAEQRKCKASESAGEMEANVNEISNSEENKRRCMAVGLTCNRNKLGHTVDTGFMVSANKASAVVDDFMHVFHKQFLQNFTVIVPDADFHDFHRNRMEKCFKDGQVWVAYDVNDGMPRCYVMIQSVVSLTPFNMQISWLNSNISCELSSPNFTASGLRRTWGDFKLGKCETWESVDCFSHKVKWTKAACGAIQIFPVKGDVWALYRNWSAEWNELTEDDVIQKYEVVEVLEDYEEREGIIVIPLVKVSGFKTLFHRSLNPWQIRKIPSEEMSRFSHRIPSYILTGKEGPNAPKGCRELDPAATPSELLQIIMDVEEQFAVNDVGEDVQNEVEMGVSEAGEGLLVSCGEIT